MTYRTSPHPLDGYCLAHQTCGCIQCVTIASYEVKLYICTQFSLSVYFMLLVSIPVRLVHSVAITSHILGLLCHTL